MKYFSLLLMFKDVEARYREDKGAGHPFYLDSILIGQVLKMIGVLMTIAFGIVLSQTTIDTWSQTLPAVISGLIMLYGAAMTVVSQIRTKKADAATHVDLQAQVTNGQGNCGPVAAPQGSGPGPELAPGKACGGVQESGGASIDGPDPGPSTRDGR